MSCYFSRRIIWFRWADDYGWALHTPLSKPLFSERHGYNKPRFKLWKFRLFRLEPKDLGR